MKKLHLILLSLVAAMPGGYLCYLLGAALAMPRTDLWKKPLLGGAVFGTGLLVLGLAVVWPLLYAFAFYDDPSKSRKPEDDEADAGDEVLSDDEAEDGKPKTPRSESFEDEDVDVFEREGATEDAEEVEEAEDVEDVEDAATGDEFDLDEESIDQAETADFDLSDDDFADMEMEEEVEEEEEEAPKKKAKKKKK